MNKLTATAIILFNLPCTSFAHDWDNKLGPSPSASDYYQVNCYNNQDGTGETTNLEVTLLTTSKAAPVVSLQIKTDDSSIPFIITNITDPISGDQNTSRTINITNNSANTTDATSHNGYYYITVNKTKAGIQSYHFTYHCLGQNGHAGTDITTLQDQ